jgi:GNAT superfamily N-acetyltransferase
MITVRPTTLDDLENAGRVFAAAYGALLPADYDAATLAPVLPLISQAKPELVASGTYFGAFENDRLIAVGGWTPHHPAGGASVGIGHVRHVATDPAHLRKGAARLLLHHAFAQARSAGIETMECLSTLTAEPFYRSLGFRPIARRDIRIGGHAFPCVDMVMPLATVADAAALVAVAKRLP